jgi:hypothetical protein
LQSHRLAAPDQIVIDNPGEYWIKGWQTRGWSAFADHDG